MCGRRRMALPLTRPISNDTRLDAGFAETLVQGGVNAWTIIVIVALRGIGRIVAALGGHLIVDWAAAVIVVSSTLV
jgi:hypothetical protein